MMIGLDVVTLAVGARREHESGIKGARCAANGGLRAWWSDLQAGFIIFASPSLPEVQILTGGTMSQSSSCSVEPVVLRAPSGAQYHLDLSSDELAGPWGGATLTQHTDGTLIIDVITPRAMN
jgi:hypothetical protein